MFKMVSCNLVTTIVAAIRFNRPKEIQFQKATLLFIIIQSPDWKIRVILGYHADIWILKLKTERINKKIKVNFISVIVLL